MDIVIFDETKRQRSSSPNRSWDVTHEFNAVYVRPQGKYNTIWCEHINFYSKW